MANSSEPTATCAVMMCVCSQPPSWIGERSTAESSRLAQAGTENLTIHVPAPSSNLHGDQADERARQAAQAAGLRERAAAPATRAATMCSDSTAARNK